jgi:hypothetical protein
MQRGTGADHPMAQILQHFRGRHCDQGIVIDKQDHGRALDLLRGGRRGFSFRGGCRDGQHHGDGGALPDRAGELKRPAELNDETVHHRQAETGALAQRLRREKRFDRPLQDFRRHPRAGVDDGEFEISAGL